MGGQLTLRQYIVPGGDKRLRVPFRNCIYFAAQPEDGIEAARLAARTGIRLYRAATRVELDTLMSATGSRIVLADYSNPNGDWRYILNLLEERYPGTVLIVACDVCDARKWEEVIPAGGFDVVLKPFSEFELLLVLGEAERYAPLIAPAAVAARQAAVMKAIRKEEAQPGTADEDEATG
jgi:DNA-binding NtrC family response regulator